MLSDAEKAIHSWPSDTPEQRQAQVDALIALAEDPADPYDGHHGHDRTAEVGLDRLDPEGTRG